MIQCCDKINKTYKVILSFQRKELLYDIGNYAYVEADTMASGNEYARNQVYDVIEEGNIDRINRVLSLAYQECIDLLYPYTQTAIQDDTNELNDIMQTPEQYVVTLNLPQTFSFTTVELLNTLLHEYIVYRAVSDWMSIAKPESYQTWEIKVQEIKDKIRTSVYFRRGKMKRKMKPF